MRYFSGLVHRSIDFSKPIFARFEAMDDPIQVDDRRNLINRDGIDSIGDDRPESPSHGWRWTVMCDPHGNVHRFVVLIFICFLSFGNYFCYDNAAALEDNIMEDMEVNAEKYGLLYTVYSWPNVILAFFGGYLMDRVFGLRLGAVIFASFIMLGQVVFASGALGNSFNWMIAGRFIYAIGGESLAVAQNMYAVKWFKGKELNLVFGIQLSLSRVGSTVNMYVMKPMYDRMATTFGSGHKSLGLSLLLAGGTTTVFSFFCALILLFFDKRYDRLMETPKVVDHRPVAIAGEIEPTPETDVIKPKDILKFPLTFWLLCAVCVAYYVAIFPFVAYGLVFFASKYQMDGFQADVCNSLIYLISIGASPIWGLLVDYTGRNVLWITISVIFTALAHGLMAFTFVTPFLAMAVIGVFYSLLAASLWPCVAFIVEPKVLGTAYGVMQSIQNLGLALLFLSVGVVVDARGYLTLELYFLVWLSVALCASLGLWFVDASRGGLLNLTKKQRLDRMEESTEKIH